MAMKLDQVHYLVRKELWKTAVGKESRRIIWLHSGVELVGLPS